MLTSAKIVFSVYGVVFFLLCRGISSLNPELANGETPTSDYLPQVRTWIVIAERILTRVDCCSRVLSLRRHHDMLQVRTRPLPLEDLPQQP